MLWSQFQFNLAVKLDWHELVNIKSSGYHEKIKAIYKLEHGIKRFNQGLESKLEEEDLSLNCAYGYKLYCKANKSQLNDLSDVNDFILGPDVVRKNTKILSNFGISSVVPYPTTKKNMEKSKDYNSRGGTMEIEGGVLSEKNWWPFLNDAWILGGVHNHCVFNLYIPRNERQLKDSVLWDEVAARPRVLGRELIALAAFGYRRVLVENLYLSYSFVPTDRQLTQGATFGGIRTAVSQFNSAQDIQRLLDSDHGIKYDKYDYSIMGKQEFEVVETVTAYPDGMTGSIHSRCEILSGTLSIIPGGVHEYLRVRVQNARVRVIMTGQPTEVKDCISEIVYMHKDIFGQNSYVVKPIL